MKAVMIVAKALVLTFGLASALSALATEPEVRPIPGAPVRTILALAHARTLDELQAIAATEAARQSPSAQVVLAMRRLGLEDGSSAENGVMVSIPNSLTSFNSFLALTEVKQLEQDKAVSAIFNDYFKTIAEILKRRPDVEMAGFLRLAAFADGEIKDQLDDWLILLNRLDPSRFCMALRKLPPKEQRYVPAACTAAPAEKK